MAFRNNTENKTKNRALIVNADDFGENSPINIGIIDAHKNGIVTSASLLTNMSGFEHAVALLKETPSLDVGVHLNMHRGVPLTVCPYLTRNGILLHKPFIFAIRCYLDRNRARDEIMKEFSAQLQKAIGAGVCVSHLDTEKHLHVLPLVFDVVVSLAQKYKIPSIRVPYERLTVRSLLNPIQFLKLLPMMVFAFHNKHTLRQSGIRSPRNFLGVSLSRLISVSVLQRVFNNLPEGITELSCHPGYATGGNGNYIDAHREKELATLTDFELKRSLTESGIVLSTFSDIR